MRRISFEKGAFQDFNAWATEDKKIHRRIVSLIMDVVRQPFQGIGKPEPLRNQLKGYWSRRITAKHRLVYKVDEDQIIVVACKYHYE